MPQDEIETIVIKLTPEQAEHLCQLLDVAVKAAGIEAAKVAVPIMDTLMQSVQNNVPREK